MKRNFEYSVNTPVEIPAHKGWPATVHCFDEDTVPALYAAEAAGRPLLIRGETGTGKSQTARAAAVCAGRPFLSHVINGRTEAPDLKFRFDAVARLAAAQARKSGDPELRPERDFVRPGVLWWAYNWDQALAHNADRPSPFYKPDSWDWRSNRAVLLIDEIDKADPEVPNALLDVLGNSGFQVPYGPIDVECAERARQPLVIITTNDERELPGPFLRRCLVLHISMPEGAALEEYLVQRGKAHQQLELREHAREGKCVILEPAARALVRVRAELGREGYRPGVAEYLDLTAMLANLWPDNEIEQTRQLERLMSFVTRKTAEEIRA